VRIIFIALGVLLLGGAAFLAAWDITPPSAPKEIVIPDERLGR
jgi:hypothetical protein